MTITLDDSFTASVCDYSLGFLKFRVEGRQEVATPAGTGTFVKLGRVYGILTAGHVLKALDPQTTVGLVRFPSVQPPIQNRRLNLRTRSVLSTGMKRNATRPTSDFSRYLSWTRANSTPQAPYSTTLGSPVNTRQASQSVTLVYVMRWWGSSVNGRKRCQPFSRKA